MIRLSDEYEFADSRSSGSCILKPVANSNRSSPIHHPSCVDFRTADAPDGFLDVGAMTNGSSAKTSHSQKETQHGQCSRPLHEINGVRNDSSECEPTTTSSALVDDCMFPAWNNTHDVVMHSSPPRNTKDRPPASIKVDHEKASAIQDVHVVGAFPEGALPRNGTTAGGIIINVDVVPDECNQSCPGDYRGVGERGSRRLSLEIAVGSPRGPRPSGRGRNAGRGSAGTNSGMIGSNGAVGGVGLGAKANKIGRNQGGNVRSAVLLSKSRSESLHDISTPHHNVLPNVDDIDDDALRMQWLALSSASRDSIKSSRSFRLGGRNRGPPRAAGLFLSVRSSPPAWSQQQQAAGARRDGAAFTLPLRTEEEEETLVVSPTSLFEVSPADGSTAEDLRLLNRSQSGPSVPFANRAPWGTHTHDAQPPDTTSSRREVEEQEDPSTYDNLQELIEGDELSDRSRSRARTGSANSIDTHDSFLHSVSRPLAGRQAVQDLFPGGSRRRHSGGSSISLLGGGNYDSNPGGAGARPPGGGQHGDAGPAHDEPLAAIDRGVSSGSRRGGPPGGNYQYGGSSSSSTNYRPQQDLQYKSPFPEEERGATLDWDSLTFEVGGKKILDNCYGRLFPGEVCALIGPSGAGKSTLMNLLAARQRWNGQGLKLDGTIRFGGRPAGYEGLKDSVALIMQAESFVETQTVEESLRFAAILRGVEESISDEEVLLEAADHEPTEPEAAEQDEAEISEADETTALSPGKGSQEKKRPFLSRQDSLEYEYGDLESGRGAEPALSATLTTKSKPASSKPKSVTSTRKSARNSVSPVSRGKARKRVLARKIDETLEMLGLESCRNTPVLRISGGQKKRVGVALELISNPKILFLDEPTSGLDSFSSLQLVQNLRRVAREREAIVCLTVHQPSSELFSLFDRVYCMRYGKLLFHGLNKNMENVISACREGVAAEQAAAAVPPGPQKQAKSEPQSEQHDEMSFGTPAIISQGEHHNAATTGTGTDHKMKILAPSSAAEFVPPPYAASAARARTSGNEQDGASSATTRGGAVQSSRTKAMELCLFLKSWTIPGFLALVRQPIPMEFSTCDWLLNLAQSLDDAEIQALVRKSRSIFDAGLVSLSEFDIIVRRAIEEHLPQVKREKVLKREYVEALEAIAKDAPPMASPRVAQAGGQGTAARGIENYLPQQQDLRRDMVSGADARNGANIAGNPNHGGELAPKDGLTQTTAKNGTPPDPEPPIDPATCAPHHPYSTQKLRPRERPNCCTQVRALLIREIQSTYRNTFSLMFRVLTPIVQVALYSIAFWSTGRYLAQGQEIGPEGELVPLTERAQFSARIRDLFISIATVYFMSFTAGAQVVLLNIPAERAVFLREYTSNMYSTWAYLLSKMLVELPITMFQTLVIAGIIRGGYGYNSSFFWMWLLLFLSMTSGGAVGVAISTLTSRAEVSLVLLTVITNTIPACFGGVMRALSQIPAWVRWMKHIIQMSHIAATMGLVELEAIDVTAISEDPTAQANFEAERQAFWKGNDIRREMLPYYLSMTLLLWLLFRGLGVVFLKCGARSAID